MNTLCIDIGNSTVKIGVFYNTRLVFYDEKKPEAFYGSRSPLVSYKKYAIQKALICSVVASANKKIAAAVKKAVGIVPLIVNETCNISLKTQYSRKAFLGNDRVVNIYGALCSIKSPFIIVSCGTAITIDLVDVNGVHQGGYIVPGLNMKAHALHAFTAALPSVVIADVRKELGVSTKASMQTGIMYGTAACVEGLITRLKKKCKGKVSVIATGGDAERIKKYCSSLDRVIKKHTLITLNSILHSL